jgi:KDO2-lipid IV(A) lauroyltransferase
MVLPVHVKITIATLRGTNMTIDPQKIINSRPGINLAYFIGRYTPYWLGHRIALFGADRLSARKDWEMVRAVRCNQWVVHGENLDQAALDETVRENFRNTARSIFDLYHNINNLKIFRQIVDVHPIAEQFVHRPEYADRGLMVVGVHMSNFDFIAQAAGVVGVKAMVLAMPDMNPGYRKQLEMRREKGLNIVPASSGTIKQAIKYLRDGGVVMTGIDRPDESYPYRPKFFGRPAALPIHHIFMALKAQVPILIGSVIWRPDGKYHFLFSEPVEMQPHPDRHQEILQNAETVLHIAEDFIRQDPSQWSMTFPVWPDVMDQVPK